MRTIILAAAIVAMATGARAECLLWGQDGHGNRICLTDDLVNRNPGFPLIGDYPSISTAPGAKCDDNETLVTLPGTWIAMCARDLKPAH